MTALEQGHTSGEHSDSAELNKYFAMKVYGRNGRMDI
jgi:hypothetical protein